MRTWTAQHFARQFDQFAFNVCVCLCVREVHFFRFHWLNWLVEQIIAKKHQNRLIDTCPNQRIDSILRKILVCLSFCTDKTVQCTLNAHKRTMMCASVIKWIPWMSKNVKIHSFAHGKYIPGKCYNLYNGDVCSFSPIQIGVPIRKKGTKQMREWTSKSGRTDIRYVVVEI